MVYNFITFTLPHIEKMYTHFVIVLSKGSTAASKNRSGTDKKNLEHMRHQSGLCCTHSETDGISTLYRIATKAIQIMIKITRYPLDNFPYSMTRNFTTFSKLDM